MAASRRRMLALEKKTAEWFPRKWGLVRQETTLDFREPSSLRILSRDVTHRSLAVATALFFLAAAGCRRDEITHVRVAKRAPAAPQGSARSIAWTLPEGWTQSVASGVRTASLKPAVAGHVEVSLTVLPGTAGGNLANVNRWRGQLGLSAIDDAAIASLRATVQSKAGAFAMYDFTSEGQKKRRMIVALAVVEGGTLFVKMLGDVAPVGAARQEFISLVEGIHVVAAN